jgi:hypothetical protein
MKLRTEILATVAMFLFVSTGFADSIPVANGSFEILPAGGLPYGCGVGCSYSIGAIPGWNNYGNSGLFQPGVGAGNFSYFNSLSNGPTSAYTNVAGGTISQTVAPTSIKGATYTLTVDVGQRNDVGSTASVTLNIGGQQVTVSPASLPTGGWAPVTVSLKAATSNAPITIQLNGAGPQANFDDVQLTDNLITKSTADLTGLLVNPSFEMLPTGGLPFGCGANCSYSVDAIPGWDNSGVSGQFQPGAGAGNYTYFNSLSDGPASAYTNDAGGTISQLVSGLTVQSGVTYTLQVDVGDRNDVASTASVDLLINGHTYVASGSLVPGGWSTFTASYTGQAADAGDPITIQLNGAGPQANFDNVRLMDAQSQVLPEPSAFWLLGTVIVAIAGQRYRRRSA